MLVQKYSHFQIWSQLRLFRAFIRDIQLFLSSIGSKIAGCWCSMFKKCLFYCAFCSKMDIFSLSYNLRTIDWDINLGPNLCFIWTRSGHNSNFWRTQRPKMLIFKFQYFKHLDIIEDMIIFHWFTLLRICKKSVFGLNLT